MSSVNKPLPPEEIASILADYSSGMTIEAVAKKAHRAISTVKRHINDAGISRGQPGLARNKPEAVRRYASLIRAGLPHVRAAYIANQEYELSHTPTTYREAMDKLGIERARVRGAVQPPVEPVEPKTEVIFHDLVINVVSSTKYEHVGESAFAPVSLSAGVRVLEVAA